MAIFTGNWLDPDGVPFDGAAIGRRGAGSSHQCQVAAHHVANPILHHSYHTIMPYLTNAWYNFLDAADRASWTASAHRQVLARDYAVPVGPKGFTNFVSANWPSQFGYGGYFRKTSHDVGLNILQMEFTDASVATQTLYLRVVYVDTPAPENEAATYFYQVNPAKLASKRHHRFTRWLDTLYIWTGFTDTYVIQAKARYPFFAGNTVRVMYRHNAGTMWDYTKHVDRIAS